jgi:hypothetical protein
MTTPPQTPRSAASSVSGAVATSGVKRDAGAASEDETAKEAGVSEAKEATEGGRHVAKKRKIAPTLIGELNR